MSNPSNRLLKKLILLGVVVLLAGSVYWQFRDTLTMEYLASRESQLRSWQSSFPVGAMMVAIAVYIVVAGLSLPGAAVLTLVCGWYFGFWKGILVVSFGSTGGALVAFLLTRYLLRDWIQASMADRLAGINEAFERDGAFYLFSLRLVPAVPFFVVNAVMGLTKVTAFTFWWVSQLGMLPGTAAYVYAGSTVPSLKTLAEHGPGKVLNWQLALAFAILGILPLAIKKILSFARKSGNRNDVSSTA